MYLILIQKLRSFSIEFLTVRNNSSNNFFYLLRVYIYKFSKIETEVFIEIFMIEIDRFWAIFNAINLH